jgi:hypothetical protein
LHLKRSVEGLDILHCQRQVIEIFNTILASTTLFANHLRAGLASKD